MLENVARVVELYQARRIAHVVVDGQLFIKSVYGACPIGPVKYPFNLSPKQAQDVLKALDTSFVRWTDGFGEGRCQQYFAVTCSKFLPIEEMKSKERSRLRKALAECQVKRVDAKWVAENAYEVYASAFERYRSVVNGHMDQREFHDFYAMHSAFEDVIHCWGVFHQDKLIAFHVADVFDKVEVNYSLTKYDPKFMQLHPSYALLYRVNEHYLAEQGFEYVNTGTRALLHETNYQDFLVEKFGFKFNHTNLCVHYKPALRMAMAATYPLRGLFGRVGKLVKGVYEMESIRRQCAAAAAGASVAAL